MVSRTGFCLWVATMAFAISLVALAINAAASKPKQPHSQAFYRQAIRGQVAAKHRVERALKRERATTKRLRSRLAGAGQGARLNSDIGYAIDYVFGPDAPGARTVAHCESTWDEIGLAALGADNGQGYYGIFQLGDPGMWEIHRYAFDRYTTVLDQVLAAYRMFLDRGWGAWQCRPDGGLRW